LPLLTFSSRFVPLILKVCSSAPFSTRVTVSAPGVALIVFTSKWMSEAVTWILPPVAVLVGPLLLLPPPPHAASNGRNTTSARHASADAADASAGRRRMTKPPGDGRPRLPAGPGARRHRRRQ